jgi:Zn-dependent protease with chaperone function
MPPGAPPPPEPSRYFDGVTNRRQNVAVYVETTLEIFAEAELLASWPYDSLRAVEGAAEPLVLRCASAPPLARLHIRDAALAAAIRQQAKYLDADAGEGNTARIVAWSVAAIASIVAIILFGLPLMADRLAPLVPYALEQRYGDLADRQVRTIFGTGVCTSPRGTAALNKLVTEVRDASGLTTPLQTSVLRTYIPNAFALPGGRVYVLSVLLQRAKSPDELAAVLAHEFGHLRHRDHMRALIQNAGTSFLVGLLFGDVTGSGATLFATRTLLELQYSREKEAQADTFAVEVMHKLGRSPKPLGDLLERLSGPKPASGRSNFSIFTNHPLTEDRRAMLAREDRPATGPELLTDSEWKDLQAICGLPAVPRVPPRPPAVMKPNSADVSAGWPKARTSNQPARPATRPVTSPNAIPPEP